MEKKVKIKVPATTANLGPGFDCLGMTLDRWNSLEVSIGGNDFKIYGEGSKSLVKDKSNLIYKSLSTFFKEIGRTMPDVSIISRNNIPLSRGLGSSSAAIVSGLVAGNELCERPLNNIQLLKLAAQIEGHPDNVAPALLGGFQIVVNDSGRLVTQKVDITSKLKAILFIPEIPMSTDHARNILANDVERKDAIYNISRTALLISSLITGNLEHLRIATQDKLHQPARQSLFPPMYKVFEEASKAGASGVFLSGGGSTILALAENNLGNIGEAMQKAAKNYSINGILDEVTVAVKGAHLID